LTYTIRWYQLRVSLKKIRKYKIEYKGIVVIDLPSDRCTKYNHYTSYV